MLKGKKAATFLFLAGVFCTIVSIIISLRSDNYIQAVLIAMILVFVYAGVSGVESLNNKKDFLVPKNIKLGSVLEILGKIQSQDMKRGKYFYFLCKVLHEDDDDEFFVKSNQEEIMEGNIIIVSQGEIISPTFDVLKQKASIQ